MMESGKINCSRIECALDIHVKAKSHRAVDVGQAEDGTHCGDRSVRTSYTLSHSLNSIRKKNPKS